MAPAAPPPQPAPPAPPAQVQQVQINEDDGTSDSDCNVIPPTPEQAKQDDSSSEIEVLSQEGDSTRPIFLSGDSDSQATELYDYTQDSGRPRLEECVHGIRAACNCPPGPRSLPRSTQESAQVGQKQSKSKRSAIQMQIYYDQH